MAQYGKKYAVITDIGDWDNFGELLEKFVMRYCRVLKNGGQQLFSLTYGK